MDEIIFTDSDIRYSTIKIFSNLTNVVNEELIYKNNKVKLSTIKNEIGEYINHYFNNNSETNNMINGDWHGYISLYDAVGDDYYMETFPKSLCWTINEFEFNETYQKATIEIYFTDEAFSKLLKWGNFLLE